ncbi:MAG: hypothetical protein AAGD14_02490 [Planctomycetota bacterium]
MGTREGRYVPGEDMNFAWGDDLGAAQAEVAARKGRGGVLLYVYDETDQAPHVQNEVLMDPAVRFFGGQNPAVKRKRSEVPLDLKETPAVVVYGKDGKIKKLLSGKAIKARSLAAALRKIAPNRRLPK